MPFKIRGYKRLENRDTIEVIVQNETVDLEGLIHIRGREHGVYFNGKLCYVPRLCQIMDETECDGLTLKVVDGKSFYFNLDESSVHSWVTGNPGSVQHSVWRNPDPYVTEEFTLAVKSLFDSRSRGNGTYFGDDKTRIYLNGKNVLTWPDIFLEGNRVKKLVWHWHYCATMDKYVKRLSEVWFVNSEIEKEKSGGDILAKVIVFDVDTGVKCRITRVDKDYRWKCHFVYLTAVDSTGKEHSYTFKIQDDNAFTIVGGKRSDLDSWIAFSKWLVRSIAYMPNPNGYDILTSMNVVDMTDVYAVPNPEYDIHVLKTRIVELNSKYGIKPVEFIPYDPSEFEFKPSNNKEEIKMSKTIKEVWDSMTREQQDVCCVLIGEAAKKNSSLDYEIKRKVAAIRAGEYMIRVTGSDIRDIVFNGPATIILWRDGSKTVIKQQKGDKWDPEKAVAMAVMKKVFGTNETGSNYLEFVKPYIEKALEEDKKRTDKDISK